MGILSPSPPILYSPKCNNYLPKQHISASFTDLRSRSHSPCCTDGSGSQEMSPPRTGTREPSFSPGGCGSQGVLCELLLPVSIHSGFTGQESEENVAEKLCVPLEKGTGLGRLHTPSSACPVQRSPDTLLSSPSLSSQMLGLTESKLNISSNQSICPHHFC